MSIKETMKTKARKVKEYIVDHKRLIATDAAIILGSFGVIAAATIVYNKAEQDKEHNNTEHDGVIEEAIIETDAIDEIPDTEESYEQESDEPETDYTVEE